VINVTFLSLISKEREETKIDKAHLIALLNSIYKNYHKAITNRLIPIKNKFTSKEQRNYIKCHQILYGIIIVHELIQYLNLSKNMAMTMKLEMSKFFYILN
jgi:hypothetical protein